MYLLILQGSAEVEFFTEYGEGSRYKILEFLGKGSYGVVCSAYDTHRGEKVAIKKIANVFHRDLKPKNILANADCKLKICDFGLARAALNDTSTAVFWTDYIATRWYRAPELCGSFLSKYTPAIDIWSIGCIFAELLTGKPLFPGKNSVHQLDLITDLLGTPSPEAIAKIRNEKARRYLSCMKRKKPVPFSQKFPNADPVALRLLEKMLAFEPKDRPSAEEALSDPYFKNLANVRREPSAQPVPKLEFEFETRKITKEDVQELIYREILEYHPNMLKDYLEGSESTSFMYPSAVEHLKSQYAHLEEHSEKGGTVAPPKRQHASLPRQSVLYANESAHSVAEVTNDLAECSIKDTERSHTNTEKTPSIPLTRPPIQVPRYVQGTSVRPGKAVCSVSRYNTSGVSVAESVDKKLSIRSPDVLTRYANSSSSYRRRNLGDKNEMVEDKTEGSNMQPRPTFMSTSKEGGAQGVPGNKHC
ncbi:hypothetical protein ACET3Z_002156 [Daucus carota]